MIVLPSDYTAKKTSAIQVNSFTCQTEFSLDQLQYLITNQCFTLQTIPISWAAVLVFNYCFT